MAQYKAREYRAITWYAMEYGLRLSLCQRPWVYYYDENDEMVSERLHEIVQAWDQHLKEEQRAKARQQP